MANMNAGGAETFLMKVYRQLDTAKYQMDFCINVKEKCFYEDEIIDRGGRIFRIPMKSENLKEFKKQFTALVKKNAYEYVFRITSNGAGLMDLKLAKKAGAKVTSARSSNSSDGGGAKVWIAHRLGRLLYQKYVDVKFAPSDLAAQYTFGKKAYKNGKVDILHNGVDLDVYHFDAQGREDIRREFHIADNVTVVGHVGRLMEQKNHRFLLEIFSQIHKKNPNTVLLLVGKGELESQLKEQAESLGLTDAVIFAGVRKDVPQMLSAMDVFVFPSFYEGMPNTVIEAQATGLPCVIADTITREADITGLVEYLSLNDSAEQWANIALSKVSADRKDTKADFIDNEYDIQSVADKFVSLVFAEKE